MKLVFKLRDLEVDLPETENRSGTSIEDIERMIPDATRNERRALEARIASFITSMLLYGEDRSYITENPDRAMP